MKSFNYRKAGLKPCTKPTPIRELIKLRHQGGGPFVFTIVKLPDHVRELEDMEPEFYNRYTWTDNIIPGMSPMITIDLKR